MGIIELRHEHALLCEELAVLKRAEGGDSSRLSQTLHEVCERLSAGLLEHMRREEGSPTARPSSDHYSDYRYLQVITRRVNSANGPYLLRNHYQLLAGFLRGLHRHMDQQEADLLSVSEPSLMLAGA